MSLETLTPTQRAVWTSTFSDLTLCTRIAVALMRGTANPIEETAMAKMCNPGKTKHLTKEQRGFLAFESTLDRASALLKAADPKGLASSYATKCEQAIPRDALISAKAYDAMVGQTMLANAYDKVQHARTLFILVKEKYGDNLKHAGTLTLEGKAKRVSKAKEVDVMQSLRVLLKDDAAALGAEVLKYLENPAAYVLPGTVAAPTVETLVAQASAAASA